MPRRAAQGADHGEGRRAVPEQGRQRACPKLDLDLLVGDRRPGLLRRRDLDRREGLRHLPGQADYAVPAKIFAAVQSSVLEQQQKHRTTDQPDLDGARDRPARTGSTNPKNEGDENVARRGHDPRVVGRQPRRAARRRQRPAEARGPARPQPAAAAAAAAGSSPRAGSRSGTSIKKAKVDIWTGKDDKTLRRARRSSLVRPAARACSSQAQGVKGGDVKLHVEVADVNKKQDIKAPANARPWSELQQQLGARRAGRRAAAAAVGGSPARSVRRAPAGPAPARSARSGTSSGPDRKQLGRRAGPAARSAGAISDRRQKRPAAPYLQLRAGATKRATTTAVRQPATSEPEHIRSISFNEMPAVTVRLS